ncbi:BsaA family SipW-dependent biofilm matrix protein [Clostridium culturomicium]|uniref:BsaA family SipW-dependent biofilm matrix protein n=1 Tax=Clostridium culturomicium TaxID=1499683 RepID=UPI0005914AFA|nr:BsaA family SipW-dependent biofilm matrix protein [Clostridium culturomicium]
MKNKKLVAITGLTAVAVVGGSLAYFNQTMTVENPFDTNKYASELVETFNPTDGDNWQPGETVNKDIQVENTGDYDVIVRVKFDETWTRKGGDAYVIKEGLNNTASQENANDGLTERDYSVVAKNLVNDDKWIYNLNDGYYYYKTNLAKGENTDKFLDSVTLLENADMGRYEEIKYYTIADVKPDNTNIGDDESTQWVKYTGEVPTGAKHTRTVTQIVKGAEGYADSDYKLTITAQTVQATSSAVQDAFGTTNIAGTSWSLDQ